MGETVHQPGRAMVHIGTGLDVPLAFATSKTAFLAGSGAGKTYTMTMIAEQFIRAGVQTIAVDPVSKWWALTCNADGSPSGLPVVIIGGPRADLPLEWGRGKDIADVVVDHKITAILDLSDLDDDEQAIFVAAFSERLLFRKRKVNSVMHLFWDEVQDCAPEVPRGKYQSRMLGKVERLLKQIRNHGGGWTVGSQQPQAVSKRVLNEATTIFAMRTPGAGNRAQIEKMLKDQIGDAEAHAVVRTLAKELPKHHAKAWSMDFFDDVQTVEFVRKSTYDSSRTPAHPPPAKPVEDLARVRRILDAFQGKIMPTVGHIKSALERLDEASQYATTELSALNRIPLAIQSASLAHHASAVSTVKQHATNGVGASSVSARAAMPARHREILQAVGVYCRDHAVAGVEPKRVAGIVGMAFAGGFKNYIGALVASGWLERGPGGLALTSMGRLACGGLPEQAKTTEEILDLWRPKLPTKAMLLLEELVTNRRSGRTGLTMQAAADHVRMALAGGFKNYVGQLRRFGLVERTKTGIYASSVLFPMESTQ